MAEPALKRMTLNDFLTWEDARYAELHRRSGEQWIVEILREPGDRIRLTSVGTEIPLAEL